MEYDITMTNKEAQRHKIIVNLISQKINGTEAAKQLKLSVRQAKRLKANVIKDGVTGIIHGLRGTIGNHKLDQKIVKKAIKLIRKEYSDFGPTLAQEKLKDIHEISIGVSTIRRIMIDEKIYKPKPRKKNSEHREWRERKAGFGEMGQFDGSYHDWFEGRAPECCLLGNIDDATGKVTLKFDTNESIACVFKFWKEYIQGKGKPLAIYLDKYSTYKINHKSAVDNKDLITQFQRAMDTLDINLISAHSPQAKGRIERLFETLQDRLIKELRLRKISSIEKANQFLKEEYEEIFNNKFGVVPRSEANLHREMTKFEKQNIDAIFSVHSQRLVHNDFTIQFKNQWIQLAETQPTTVYKKSNVIIEERLDGSLHVGLKGKYLNYTVLPERPQKVKMLLPALTAVKSTWRPSENHPWRKLHIQNAKQLTHQNSQV